MATATARRNANGTGILPWTPRVHGPTAVVRDFPTVARAPTVSSGDANQLAGTDSLGARRNRLLGALPAQDFARLAAYLEPVGVQQGDVIYESGRPLRSACFPTTSVISLQCFTQSGASVEVAAVGAEGVVGVPLTAVSDAAPGAALVQAAGQAYRLPVQHLQHELNRGGPLAGLLLHHAQALITQLTQIAVCNRHHTIEQQFCRWLLAASDRVPSGLLSVTQDLVARALGVRREGVTRAAGRMQQAGLIRCRRGRIAVIDRAGLELRSCECYGVIRSELERLPGSTAGIQSTHHTGGITPCATTRDC